TPRVETDAGRHLSATPRRRCTGLLWVSSPCARPGSHVPKLAAPKLGRVWTRAVFEEAGCNFFLADGADASGKKVEARRFAPAQVPIFEAPRIRGIAQTSRDCALHLRRACC